MKLKDYIASQGITVSAFAKRVGRTRVTVYRHMSGTRTPSPEDMHRYFEVTAGAVTPNDFYDLPAVDGRTVASHESGFDPHLEGTAA